MSATSFSGSIAASNINSGTLGTDRIPNLAASKITSGTFADARIASSNVSQHATSFDDDKIYRVVSVNDNPIKNAQDFEIKLLVSLN